MHIHIDFETRSTVELTTAGLENYASHPDTDVWCMAWAVDEEEPIVWLPEYKIIPIELLNTVDYCPVFAHNAHFELAIWNQIMVPRYGWPKLDPAQCRCTMAMCYSMGLPGSLEKASAAMGITMRKDLEGQRLMMQMAKPKSVLPLTWWDEEDKQQKLYEYCKQDVRVERELAKRALNLSHEEQRLWAVDYAINRRGVPVDRQAVLSAIPIVEREQERLSEELRTVSQGKVSRPSEVAALTRWCVSRGVDCPSLQRTDVLDLLSQLDLPADVRRALEIRYEFAKTSTAKLKSMLECSTKDGRVMYPLQYHAAATGRWGGRRMQPHNFPRPSLNQYEIEAVLDCIVNVPVEKAIRFIGLLYGHPLEVISSCLRGLICAPEGHELLAGDFANIEGRVLAWLAQERWKLDAFKAYDAGTGDDLYLLSASRIYHRPTSDFTKKSPERQIGKVAELACGYGGGVGAFQTMAYTYGVRVPKYEAEVIKEAWRQANPNIKQYWYDLESAATSAVTTPGVVYAVRNVKFRTKGSFLFCQLPNGRLLTYPYPKMKLREMPWGEEREQIHYMHVNGMTNKWEETHTYGGKLSENITQAVSRDILADAILRCESAGYPVILHVHDEIVSELPTGHGDLAHFTQLMAEVPSWATGLPIAVEGWRGKRYRK
jgi:DNA polymerase